MWGCMLGANQPYTSQFCDCTIALSQVAMGILVPVIKLHHSATSHWGNSFSIVKLQEMEQAIAPSSKKTLNIFMTTEVCNVFLCCAYKVYYILFIYCVMHMPTCWCCGKHVTVWIQPMGLRNQNVLSRSAFIHWPTSLTNYDQLILSHKSLLALMKFFMNILQNLPNIPFCGYFFAVGHIGELPSLHK